MHRRFASNIHHHHPLYCFKCMENFNAFRIKNSVTTCHLLFSWAYSETAWCIAREHFVQISFLLNSYRNPQSTRGTSFKEERCVEDKNGPQQPYTFNVSHESTFDILSVCKRRFYSTYLHTWEMWMKLNLFNIIRAPP